VISAHMLNVVVICSLCAGDGLHHVCVVKPCQSCSFIGVVARAWKVFYLCQTGWTRVSVVHTRIMKKRQETQWRKKASRQSVGPCW